MAGVGAQVVEVGWGDVKKIVVLLSLEINVRLCSITRI
jgi:hypothetical protein